MLYVMGNISAVSGFEQLDGGYRENTGEQTSQCFLQWRVCTSRAPQNDPLGCWKKMLGPLFPSLFHSFNFRICVYQGIFIDKDVLSEEFEEHCAR